MTPGQQVSSSGSLPPSLATWGGGACLPVNTSNSTGRWRISLEMCWWAGRQRGFLLLSYLLGAQPCHFDLPETRTDCLRWGREPHLEWFNGKMSVHGTVHLTGQPRIWSPGHRNGPIRFLEPFCHLEENSVPSYLFKECSRPYLLAINRSSQDVTGCVISWECSP